MNGYLLMLNFPIIRNAYVKSRLAFDLIRIMRNCSTIGYNRHLITNPFPPIPNERWNGDQAIIFG